MPKQWKLKPKAPIQFRQKFPEYSELLNQLLYNRGLYEQEEIEKFLNPKYEDLHNPFLFQDMQKAVERIWQAIDQQEKIFIYGDYDADAVTANAVLQQTFRYLGVSVQSYIPDRFAEGYGLNLDAFEKIKAEGAQVVITVDCGTNSVDSAEFCKKNGIDLIITDHHEILGDLPKAFALINPKNPKDHYPFSQLTGVGVAFKLACAILENPQSAIRNPQFVFGYEKWLLDFVAIGTVADCHELVGENRILVKYGLKVLIKSRWAGTRALIRAAGLNFQQRTPDTYTLGFMIAPRLNAAGRLEHANIALELLMQDDVSAAQEQALYLDQVNSRRQQMTDRVLSEAREQAEKLANYKILLVLGQDWPKGVVGLAAGKLAEEFNKPTIVLEKGDMESTGSARTVGEFSIIEMLKAGSDHLIKFGGHQQAAGLTLKTSEYEIFYQKILKHAEEHLKESDLEKVLELEAELGEEDLTIERLEELKDLEPFGAGNPNPIFLLSGAEITSLRAVGNGQKHLQAQFKIGEKIISSIGFGQGFRSSMLRVGDVVDVAAELIEDSWNGNSQVKLKIVDVRAHQEGK